MTNCPNVAPALPPRDWWPRMNKLFSKLPEGAQDLLVGDSDPSNDTGAGVGRDIKLGDLVKFWIKHRDGKWTPTTTWLLAINFFTRTRTDHSREWMPEANNLLLCAALLQEASEFDDMEGFLAELYDHVKYVLRAALGTDRVPSAGLTDEVFCRAVKRGFPLLHEACTIRGDPVKIDAFLAKRQSLLPKGSHTIMKIEAFSAKDQSLLPEEEYTIRFVEDYGKKETVEVPRIPQSTKFKRVVAHYAEVQGVSPRFLRFSFKGKMMFLSTIGNLTPIQLEMEPDMTPTIIVTDVSRAIKEQGEEGGSSSLASNQKKKRTKKGKQKRKRKPKQQPPAGEKTAEEELKELKIEHSKRLTKIYDEAQPQMKLIRQRLNNLLIEKSPPKDKSALHSNRTPLAPRPISHNIPSDHLGGKAGKSQFMIHAGEVPNLYKTSKRKHKAASVSNQRRQPLVIDLHGLRKDEAVQALDESLPGWNDVAMSGAYPFVVPVRIICGGGGQVLSEVVERWIQCNDRVANAPQKV